MANSTMIIREIFADRLRKAMDYREIITNILYEEVLYVFRIVI